MLAIIDAHPQVRRHAESRRTKVLAPVPPFLGPGFRLGARWNRLGEAVKTRKKREKTGKNWARYGLRSVKEEGTGGITWRGEAPEAAEGGGKPPKAGAAAAVPGLAN